MSINAVTNLMLDVTDLCNRKCKTCPRGEYHESTQYPPIGTEDRIEIIKRLNRYLIDNKYTPEGKMREYEPIDFVYLSGGEPLLEEVRDGTFTIADYCREKGMFVDIYTNGDEFLNGLEIGEVYKHANNVTVGIHDIDNLPELMSIARNNKPEDESIIFKIIADKENSEKIIDITNKHIIKHIEELQNKNIHVVYGDRIPYNDVRDVSFENGSDLMERLYKKIHQSKDKTNTHIQLKNDQNTAVPTMCEQNKNTITVDAYGNMRFCPGMLGPNFGNILTEDIGEIFDKKYEMIEVLKTYDLYGVPFLIAKERAKEMGIRFEKDYRVYCASVLGKIFEISDDPEELAELFEKKISETHPLVDNLDEILPDISKMINTIHKLLPVWGRRTLQNNLRFDINPDYLEAVNEERENRIESEMKI